MAVGRIQTRTQVGLSLVFPQLLTIIVSKDCAPLHCPLPLPIFFSRLDTARQPDVNITTMASNRRTDILSLIHLRSDGRRPHEIRHMSCHLGALPSTTDCGSALPTSACSGSSLVSMGLTQVLCVVRGPCEVGRRSEELPDRYAYDMCVYCSYSVASQLTSLLQWNFIQSDT